MTKEPKGTEVEIMGKVYQIKCPEDESHNLKKAAQFLETKMKSMRELSNALSTDKIAIVTALNIAYQFLNLENLSQTHSQTLQQRLHDLQEKIEAALARNSQLELQPAD